MIFDTTAQKIVGNLGWVDKGTIWTFDVKGGIEGRIPVDGTTYVDLRRGAAGLFRLVHHHSADQAVSVRRVAEPDRELASVRFASGRPSFTGDPDFWRHVDPIVRINTPEGQRFRLIDAARGRVTDLDLSWFTAGDYDRGYQGLVDCISLPGTDQVVVSVQRSSKLIVIDAVQNKAVGAIELRGRGGNPQLRLSGGDFLASDYDTLCRVDIRSLSVVRSARLQPGPRPRMSQFIGNYDIGRGTCVVARPFSGDVVLLDSKTLKLLGRAEIGGQPLDVCLISETSVVTREWKTGRVAMGRLAAPLFAKILNRLRYRRNVEPPDC